MSDQTWPDAVIDWSVIGADERAMEDCLQIHDQRTHKILALLSDDLSHEVIVNVAAVITGEHADDPAGCSPFGCARGDEAS